jgi:hypothetical protein
MRKRRAIIFNYSERDQKALKLFFDVKGYETNILRQPSVCPIYSLHEAETCSGPLVCCDIMVVVDDVTNRKGLDLLLAQLRCGCKLNPRNKAIISKMLTDDQRAAVKAMGTTVIYNPIDFGELEAWVQGCQKRMDLSQRLAVKRKAPRQACNLKIRYRALNGDADGQACALNVSTCGICIKTTDCLKLRQVLHLWSEEPRISEDAEVRWIQKAEDRTYLVGLTFCVA